MKYSDALLPGMLILASSMPVVAEEIRTATIGDAEIVYDYATTDTGVAVLTLVGLVPESNDALRGLKNSDPRRLGKLGQLIYQCKLMIFRGAPDDEATYPVLVSKNYSLFTGVDLALDADERIGIRVEALRAVDEASLFSDTLGERAVQTGIWETVGDRSALDLKQFNVNLLKENDLVHSSESVDIGIRFPVFQLDKPVNQWIYNFRLADFKQAVRRIDEDCAPARLVDLVKRDS